MDVRPLLRADWRVLAACVAIVLAVSAPPTSLVVGGLVGVVLILSSRPLTVRMDLANWAALTLPVLAAFSILWSVNASISIRAAVTYASLAALFIATRHVAVTRTQVMLTASAYLLGCFVLVSRLTVAWATLDRSGPALRANLPDVNANYSGYALAAGLAVLVIVSRFLGARPLRIASAGVIATVLLLGIAMSESRAAIVSALLLMAWIGVSWVMRRPPIRTLTAVIGVSALAIATGAVDRLALWAEETVGGEGRGTSGRLELWPLAREWWLDHFAFGSGASTFRDSNEYLIGAHNIILEVGTGLGLVGVGVWALFLWGVYAHRDPFLSGAFMAVAAAPLLTGHWETAPAAWVALAMVTKTSLATREAPSPQASSDLHASTLGPKESAHG